MKLITTAITAALFACPSHGLHAHQLARRGGRTQTPPRHWAWCWPSRLRSRRRPTRGQGRHDRRPRHDRVHAVGTGAANANNSADGA